MAFTITLPSNSSMSTFPDNTLTTYTTLLPEYIALRAPYECALLEATCPTTCYNLLPENILTIEGKGTPEQRHVSMTGLKMLLNRDVAQAYQTDAYNDPIFTEAAQSPFHTNTANMLERGVEVVYTRVPIVPSGGTEPNQYETQETGTYANVGLARSQISGQELQGVKYFLHLKELDPIVRGNFFGEMRKYRGFRLLGGYMPDNQALIDHLNRYFNKTQPAMVTALRAHTRRRGAMIFTYDRFTMKCTINLPPNVMAKLPENLSYQIGFGKNSFVAGKTEGRDIVDVHYKGQHIYVYSDVVENNAVGDKKVPLLRTITLDPAKGSTQTLSFQHLVYQPVCCSSFRQITVYLRDVTGYPIPFERGQVTVVLAFRPKE